MQDLTVSDVLAAQAEFDHSLEVRSIGPAIALVPERDGPMRMETLTSTDAEFQALLDEVASNPKWNELLALFDGLRCEEEGIENADLWRKEDRHVNRLEAGKRIDTYRVGEVQV